MAKRTVNYRKIWEDTIGEIPVDESGRTYEIHHLDGDRENNLPYNLACVSIAEHYRIHFEQGDYYACASISKRMQLTVEQRKILSEKISFSNRTRTLSEDSRKKISDAGKGKLNVKDAKTGLSVGRVPLDHPKVLSGEWVHFNTGVKRPAHSEFMKSIGWGKNKSEEQIKKQRESWLKTTGGTIRAMEWTVVSVETGEETKIKNLKKFCRENGYQYGKLHGGDISSGIYIKEKR